MPKYPWKRYWFDNGSSPTFDGGLLALHPENEIIALDFRSFDTFDCLVMLGDPGLGKSTELRQIEKAGSGTIVSCNLGRTPTVDYLIRETFDSRRFKEGMSRRSGVTLFLDSLDEGNQNIRGLPEVLVSEFSKVDTKKLRLRITCRSAEWSSLNYLRSELTRLWTESRFKEIRLAPLTWGDVATASAIEGLREEDFINSVREKKVSHLASNPKTLQLLIREFIRTGGLSSTQFELFEKGALELCSEPRDGRPATRADVLTPPARLVISGRIAATMALAGKSAIWTGDPAEVEVSDVTIPELVGYAERMPDGTPFSVDENAITETIGKGLFSDAGPNRVRIYHQVDAEFLAAWYLANDYFSDETIIDLIGRDFSYPQLDQVAAWITAKRAAVFEHLVRNAPLVLLRAEAITGSDESRFRLTSRLLDLFEAEEASDQWARLHYERLNHSGLAEQLRPYLLNKEKPWLVRRAAIDIAEANKIMELQGVLADIVLNVEEPLGTRMNAGYAVLRIGDSATRRRLRPLINDPHDKDHELRGIALASNWPENLTAEELFRVLEPPIMSFHGAYNMFFYQLAETLRTEDLPLALKWMARQPDIGIGYIGLDRISDRIFSLAWRAGRNNSEMLSALARAVVQRVLNHGEVLSAPSPFSTEEYRETYQEILHDDEMRRRIWLEAADFISVDQLNLLAYSKVVGLRGHDLGWLIELWSQTTSERLRETILDSVPLFIGPRETAPESVSLIEEACERYPEFAARFKHLFEPVNLDSQEAAAQREYFNKFFAWRKEKSQPDPEPISPTPYERVVNLLDEFYEGNTDAWWQLTLWMTVEPDGRSSFWEFDSDITSFPVWGQLSGPIRERLVQAAERYLGIGDPQDEKWVAEKIEFRPAIAGYRALRLILNRQPELLDNFPDDIWKKWAATIYFHPDYESRDSSIARDQQRVLIRHLYGAAPDALASVLLRDLELNSSSVDHVLSINKLEDVWDENFSAVIVDFLKEDQTTRTLLPLLDKLFAEGNPQAVSFACRLLPKQLEKGNSLDLVAVIFDLIIRHGRIDCWDEIFALLTSQPELGKEIVEKGVFHFSRSVPATFTEKQLADLFIWLATQYPHDQDPVHRGSYSPGSRDEVVEWRESILNTLVGRGTADAAVEVERVSNHFPRLTYIRFRRFETLESLRNRSWNPWNPSKIIRRFALEPQLQKERRYSELTTLQKSLDSRAERLTKFRFREHTAVTVFLAIVSVTLVVGIGWNEMEVWTWILAVAGLVAPRIYESFRLRKVSLFPSYPDVLDDERQRIYLEHGLDVNEIGFLTQEIRQLKNTLA